MASAPVLADEIRVAVASNFSKPMKRIVRHFEAATGHDVILSTGSTGKHYAQIKNGAPFDLFFAADSERPQRLEDEGIASPGSRFTYARGRLLLWSSRRDYIDGKGSILAHGDFRHLAIANEKLAPYGKAAAELLQALGLWDGLQNRLVRGENIAQTFQFVQSGNADLGLVAYSQVWPAVQALPGSYWEIPQELYAPINQQAVMLQDSRAAREFLAFIQDDVATAIMREYGYMRK